MPGCNGASRGHIPESWVMPFLRTAWDILLLSEVFVLLYEVIVEHSDVFILPHIAAGHDPA